MKNSHDKDRQAILDCLNQVYGAADLPAFRTAAVAAVAKLVDSEITAYNEVNAATQKIVMTADPEDLGFPGFEEIFFQHIAEHPLVTYQTKTRDGRAKKFSDFLSRRQFHDLGLYTDLYRRVDTEYQMAVALPSSSASIVAIAVNRQTKDFGERERSLLNVVRPHLAQAYENAIFTSQISRAMEVANLGMAVVTSQGQIKTITPTAERWLGEFFDRPTEPGRRLPERLWARVNQELALRRDDNLIPPLAAPWEVCRDGRRLLVRMSIDDNQDSCLLVLEKQQTQFSPNGLMTLGLARREAEVLFWVAQGKTNQEVGKLLDLSYGTIKKYIDRIYDKLGVTNRVEATMCALKALGLVADNP